MFKPIRFFPDDSAIAFIRYRSISYLLSGALTILALALFAGLGLNYGIDFRGGSLIEIQNKAGPADLGSLRSTLSGLQIGDVEVQEFGSPDEVLIRVEQQEGGEDAQQVVIEKVKSALGDSVEYRRVEVVGPKVSSELVQSGAIAVLVAIIAVLIYIWFRFEWQFAVGAILATVHDVVLTIGIFAGLQLEFNLSIIAAILTIVGYSLNDTVVVFDRHRENLRRYKRMPLAELLDKSINQTLSRTILTSGTTLIALGALYAFGGEVIRGFTFAMIWGVVVGTYSSIFVASPLLLLLGVKRDWSGVTQGANV
ncbi:MAG TPA: protein translocase subunit SecF [Hyphomicrobiales bacterium]|nr:protein translocase subunit SecF [Rhodobiaceae bacterium]HXK53258.1 protein translocase subunit SecF [Hyphomicrobiales bacterium]